MSALIWLKLLMREFLLRWISQNMLLVQVCMA